MTFGVLGFGGLGLRAHGYHHNLKGSVTKIHGELTAACGGAGGDGDWSGGATYVELQKHSRMQISC